MDSAGRNLAALSAVATAVLAESLCGLVAYVLVPALGDPRPAPLACLVPAIALGGLLGGSLWLGVRSARRRLAESRRLGRRVRSIALPPGGELRLAAEAAGLRGLVDLVDAEDPFSFVHGLLRPRVAISRGLVDRLSPVELRAALEHEAYHLRNRDPLRSLVARALTEALFLLPSLAVLQRRYEAGRELAADRRAEEAWGRRSLAGALLKALEGRPLPGAAAAAGLGSPDLLSLRLARLEEGREPRLSAGHASEHVWSAIGLGALLALFAAAIAGVGGPSALGRALAAELGFPDGSLQALCLAPALALSAGLLGVRRRRGMSHRAKQ